MSKRKHRREAAILYDSLTRSATPVPPAKDRDGNDAEAGDSAPSHDGRPIPDDLLAGSRELSGLLTSATQGWELPKMKKFRFQLLHRWLQENVPPCRAADVGGGKGLLAYLLSQSGWDATVIDPYPQDLPAKYKDLSSDRQIRIPPTESVPRIDRAFAPEMAREFDLLIAMHAHGCMVQLLDAAATHGRSLILLPCCIIHEPLLPPPGVHWIQCLVDQAVGRCLAVEPFRLNFKGQNIGLYIRGEGRAEA